MTHRLVLALAALASSALAPVASAENAYRCGSSYSQTPCPGAVAVDVADKRTAEQKSQADQVIQRDSKMATAMEKSRLQQEEIQRKAAQRPAEKSVAKSSPNEKTQDKPTQHARKKSRQPEYFTAKAGGKKKKNTAPVAPQDPAAANAPATK